MAKSRHIGLFCGSQTCKASVLTVTVAVLLAIGLLVACQPDALDPAVVTPVVVEEVVAEAAVVSPTSVSDALSDAGQEKPEPELQEYSLPPGTHPHDVAPAPDGSVWYTAQHLGELGRPGELWGAESGTDKLVVVRN